MLLQEGVMPAKRKRHKPEFKAQVALEAYRGDKTINQLACEHEVAAVQVSQWKRQRLLRGSGGVRQNPPRGGPGCPHSTPLPGDRSAQDGVGLVEKKIWLYPLTTSGGA